MATFPTKMVKLADIDRDILQAAWYRSEVRDDPCAEYHIGEGWGIVAGSVVAAQKDDAKEITAFYDAELIAP
jgi:hypothetical protein